MDVKKILEEYFDIQIKHLSLLGEGYDSKAYLINNEYVFKIKFSANNKNEYTKEKDIYDFLNKNLTTNIKIPNIEYAHITDEISILGYKEIKGKFLTPEIYQKMSYSEQLKLKKDIASFLKEMHNLDYSEISNYNIDNKENILEEYKLLKDTIYDDLTDKERKYIENFYEILKTTKIFDGKKCLCHNDFSSNHLLLDDNNKLVGIIDFGDAGIIDEYCDFIYLLEDSSEEIGSSFGENILKMYGDINNSLTREYQDLVEQHYPIETIVYGIRNNNKEFIDKGRKEIEVRFNRYNLLHKINSSYKYVCDNLKHVSINHSKVDELVNQIKTSSISYWLDSNPYGLLDMDKELIINFLLIYHTIGDYCFWGDPKWEINTDIGTLDGSYAIMYLIINRFKKNNNFEMSYDEFSNMLKGNVEIPLLNNRYDNLVIMNNFLKKNNKSFYEMIKDMNNDIELFEYIVSNLSYFKDESEYDGHIIYFYKRAQLLTSDILHVLEVKEKRNVDYSHLVGCADYKIPQVMRCFGMLEFDDKLSNIVDNKEVLKENSIEEIEIRSSDLAIINYMYEKLDKKYSRMDINDFIWLLSQDKSKMIKPYHRTLTSHY